MNTARKTLVWAVLAIIIAVPIAAAAVSPLHSWRDPVYIAAGFAGIIAMVFLLVQPLLIGGYLPGLSGLLGRRVHRIIGAVLVLAVAIHVAGLWLTSPPDMMDALFFASPTAFSDWGVIAMWAVIATAILAALRRPLRLRPRTWRLAHTTFAAIIVLCSVVHALLIEGAMETFSKVALCTFVVLGVVKVGTDLRVWAIRR
tara:strand:- start:1052 stop:1651 length:600 start_codon:yes stop_codon:yes gene_type:complete